MPDIITHVQSLTTLRSQLENIWTLQDAENPATDFIYRDEETGNFRINIQQVPPVIKEDESVSVVRNQSEPVLLTMVNRLGELIGNEYVFDSQEAKEIYERVHDTTTRLIDDGEGGQIEYTPPYKIGVFL